MKIKVEFQNGDIKEYECKNYMDLIPKILNDGYKSEDLKNIKYDN